ncbi:MAG: hypothetical protein K9J27_04525 [Bacteroidales bacterium]|nr:hypothetical protein [Bacteroidales bacterium]MCF8333188.1 hypothetical protein [Bacteroidales bacterium]
MKPHYFIFIILLVLFAGCEKDNDEKEFLLNNVQVDEYYDSEILNNPYFDMYGKWKLFGITGGIHGNGHELNFDFFTMKKFGIYGFIRNDSILEYGRISIDQQTADTLLIRLIPDEDSDNIFMTDNEKYVKLNAKDSLNLVSPCCDRFDYHFERAE